MGYYGNSKIRIWDCEVGYCDPQDESRLLNPSRLKRFAQGPLGSDRRSVGNIAQVFTEDFPIPIAVAGKTGTAEYWMMWRPRQINVFWPVAHTCRTLAYAPFDDPEIIVLAFAYQGVKADRWRHALWRACCNPL